MRSQVGWGMFKFPFKTGRLVEACLPLFMEMDMSTDLPGTPLILGIPFLRAYMARFDRSNKSIGLAKVPVGLFGLATQTIRVSGVIALSIAGRSCPYSIAGTALTFAPIIIATSG